jgi:hypothetical protein
MSRAVDPITVEVIGHSVSSIVEEMGETLIRASYSTNIKERRDCSTALFDAKGRTLAQAEHIPIHLGSFIGLIEAIMERVPLESVADGYTFVGNDAYNGGGTHLPDIVLASPIFFEGEIVAWAVNLAHHADFVDRGHAHIFQEGLRIPPVRLYRQGVLQEDIMAMILLNCQVPRERLNDLRAQMAANRLGIDRFRALCGKLGKELVLAAVAVIWLREPWTLSGLAGAGLALAGGLALAWSGAFGASGLVAAAVYILASLVGYSSFKPLTAAAGPRGALALTVWRHWVNTVGFVLLVLVRPGANTPLDTTGLLLALVAAVAIIVLFALRFTALTGLPLWILSAQAPTQALVAIAVTLATTGTISELTTLGIALIVVGEVMVSRARGGRLS